MNVQLRQLFDKQLERVLSELPPQVRRLLDEVPLVVEDYPSPDVLRETGVDDRAELCGLYTGVPLTERSIEHSGIPSDVVHIYREGVLHQAHESEGQIDIETLRKQIRVTILHELGHHHGLSEAALRDLGYD